MSLATTIASALYAALPRQLRCPSPRKSEAARDFDALMAELSRADTSSAGSFHDASLAVTRMPWQGPTRAVLRRARD